MIKLRTILKCSTIFVAASTVPAIAQEASTQNVETDAQSGETIIIVDGTRASIANSISAKRESDAIVDVLSADDADRFPDNNLAEALSRLPGVSFLRDDDTSDGQFISIRGLDASFNTVLNNGIRTGTADRFRRSALDVATGDGVSSIYVTKAPLPEDASEGIGGVVDIRTRGALERRESFSLGAQLRDSSFDDRTGYRLNGRFTKHLTDTLGVNVSASFRRRFLNNIRFDPTGGLNLLTPQTFTAADGSQIIVDDEDAIEIVPEDFIGVENFGLEQISYESINIRDDNFSISGTLDWELSDTTKLTAGGTYSRQNRQETISSIEFDTDDDDFVGGVLAFDDPEVAFAGILDDELEIQQSYFLRGETKLDNWQFNYIAGYSRAFRNSPDLEIEFEQELVDVAGGDDSGAAQRALTFAPFNANGVFPGPNPLNLPVFQSAIDPFCTILAGGDQGNRCGDISDFDEELEDSLLNERFSVRLDTTRSFDGSILEYVKAGLQFENSKTTDRDIDIAFNGDDLDGIAPAGANFAGDFGVFNPGSARSFSAIGSPFDDIGFTGIPLANRNALLNLRRGVLDGFDPATDTLPVGEIRILKANEDYYTGYLQAKLNFNDKFTIVGGVRLEKYNGSFASNSDVDAEIEQDFMGDDDDINIGLDQDTLIADVPLAPSNTDNFEVLPRVVATYNFSDRARIRGAFTTSISRPNFDLLGATFDTTLDIELNNDVDPNGPLTLADVNAFDATFNFGNPNLRNAYSYNFDLSFEYFFDRQNAVSIAGFYKRIDDFIFSSDAVSNFGAVDIGIGDDGGVGSSVQQIINGVQLSPFGQGVVDQLGGLDTLINSNVADISVIQPINGGTAEVYGIEIGVLHTFTYLPSFLSNFGIIGNLTLQETSADLNLGTLNDDNILVLTGEAQEGDQFIQSFPFFNSPNVIGNAALFYEDRNVEATLSYRYSGVQFESLREFGLSQYRQGRGFLDFDFEYTFRDVGPIDRVRLSFAVNDVLDGGRRFTVNETYGRAGGLTDGTNFNGRSFRLGLGLRF